MRESTVESMLSPFPSFVRFHLVRGLDPLTEALHPEELAILGENTIQSRRDELVMGRVAARRAMRGLRVPDSTPLVKDEAGAPRWPDGLVGAITHCSAMAAACVARRRDSDGLGLDLVSLARAPTTDISPRIADADESRWIHADAEQRDRRLLSLFSAKESVFKAFYPIRREYFGFAAVHLTASNGGFDAELREPMGPEYATGWTFWIGCQEHDGVIMTAVTLPAAGRT